MLLLFSFVDSYHRRYQDSPGNIAEVTEATNIFSENGLRPLESFG